MTSNTSNEYNKICIYSPSLHHDLYQKLFKCFTNYTRINRSPNILNEEGFDIAIDESVSYKDFEKTDTEMETYDSIEELQFPQEYEDGGIIILDDLNGKEMNDLRVQARFKRSRRNKLYIFINSQRYYELPKRTIRANGNIYHNFKTNNFSEVHNIYQDNASMDMT